MKRVQPRHVVKKLSIFNNNNNNQGGLETMSKPRTYKDCNIHEKINFKSWFSDTLILEGTAILNADCDYHYAACSEPRYSNECWSNTK